MYAKNLILPLLHTPNWKITPMIEFKTPFVTPLTVSSNQSQMLYMLRVLLLFACQPTSSLDG